MQGEPYRGNQQERHNSRHGDEPDHSRVTTPVRGIYELLKRCDEGGYAALAPRSLRHRRMALAAASKASRRSSVLTSGTSTINSSTPASA